MRYITIEEACTLHARIGWQGLTKKEYLDEGDYYLITGVDFDNGHIAFDRCHYVTKDRYEQDEHIQIKKDDVLVTKDGTIGKVAIIDSEADKPATLNSGVFVVRPKNPKELLPLYLVNVLLSNHFTRFIEQIKVGCTIPHLNQEKFLKFKFPLPSIEEQIYIISLFKKLNAVLNKRKEQIETLDNLIKARFVEMFGDPVTNPRGYIVQTLQQLIDSGVVTYHLDGNHGGDYPRSEEFVDSGVPYIGANCITNGNVDFSMAKYLTEERAGKLRKGIAHNEDVLFAHNATVGPTVVLHTDLPKVILSTSLTAYRCNQEKIKPNYLKAYMQSDGFVRQYSGEMKQTTRNQVPITAQKKYLFILPPLEEQIQFAAFVTQVDKSKVVIQKALDKAQLLFNSLMQQYFG